MQYIKTKVKLPQSQVTIAEFGYRVKPLVYFLQQTWVYFCLTIVPVAPNYISMLYYYHVYIKNWDTTGVIRRQSSWLGY